ncbi:hypothetical protein [Rathayibacter tritici]|uniref:hypothetical protein n=1 Tax=Rathayibacter tritici TaxID=33888 RepID=UPI0011B0E45D|nr:hypothetical protein [Rathayibacter tritici]
MKKKQTTKAFFCQVVAGSAALVLSVGAISPSVGAAEMSPPRSSALPGQPDRAALDAAISSLPGSSLPRRTHREGGMTVTHYDLGDGLTITTEAVEPSATSSIVGVSLLGGGWDVSGPSLDMNRVDQGVAASGGAAGMAAAYIASNGMCEAELRIHVPELGYPECVSSSSRHCR